MYNCVHVTTRGVCHSLCDNSGHVSLRACDNSGHVSLHYVTTWGMCHCVHVTTRSMCRHCMHVTTRHVSLHACDNSGHVSLHYVTTRGMCHCIVWQLEAWCVIASVCFLAWFYYILHYFIATNSRCDDAIGTLFNNRRFCKCVHLFTYCVYMFIFSIVVLFILHLASVLKF